MSYLVVGKERTIHLIDLRTEDLNKAQDGEVFLIDLRLMAFYSPKTESWIRILTIQNDKKKEIVKKEIGESEIFQIKNLAQLNFMSKSPPEESKGCLREYFLFQALNDFLVSKGSDPGFRMKK